MTDLDSFAGLIARDHGLCVVSVLRPDNSISSSVVNAGVLPHPATSTRVIGWGLVVVRAGWEWAAAEGPVQLIGPDDPAEGVDSERLRLLLREVFTAAGGSHDDWDAYDAVMAREHRTAVLLTPDRVYSNQR